MGKQGPCYHCGVTSTPTPLWRNGPPDKPVLYNACGSRWRTKGTLVNYTPLHSRSEPDEFEDRRVSKVKAISIKNKEARLLKRKDGYANVLDAGHYKNQNLFKELDEDTGNRSSSGSAISNSDSCMQLCSADASDLTVLVNQDSPLCKIDLKDIINFEGFASQMTNDEQQHLFKYLPPTDTIQLPDSLKSMFSSVQFKEDLFSFQKLVAQGTFDPSAPATKNEGSRTLKKFALCNMTKSKWVEQYKLLQDAKCKDDSKPSGVPKTIAPGCWVNLQRSNQFGSFPGMKSTTKNLKKASYGDNDFSPRSLFALPPDNSSLTLDYMKYVEDSSDHDLLLDVPSNTSFPLAELLPSSSFVAETTRNL